MWIIQKNAVSDEQQGSDQEFQNRFRSGGMAYSTLINKPMGFSQSLSKVPAGVAYMAKTKYHSGCDILICILPKLQYRNLISKVSVAFKEERLIEEK